MDRKPVEQGAAEGRKLRRCHCLSKGERHVPSNGSNKKRASTTIIHKGMPRTVRCPARFLGGLGVGRAVWQRQQTFLSSGFQVPQLGQFMGVEVSRCQGVRVSGCQGVEESGRVSFVAGSARVGVAQTRFHGLGDLAELGESGNQLFGVNRRL